MPDDIAGGYDPVGDMWVSSEDSDTEIKSGCGVRLRIIGVTVGAELVREERSEERLGWGRRAYFWTFFFFFLFTRLPNFPSLCTYNFIRHPNGCPKILRFGRTRRLRVALRVF